MGGESVKNQMKALEDGVDIVIGTPGRLDDLISTGKLDLSSVCCTVAVLVQFLTHLVFLSLLGSFLYS